jgi:hypothetical protein
VSFVFLSKDPLHWIAEFLKKDPGLEILKRHALVGHLVPFHCLEFPAYQRKDLNRRSELRRKSQQGA